MAVIGSWHVTNPADCEQDPELAESDKPVNPLIWSLSVAGSAKAGLTVIV
jgi:hypothetical protein